MNLRKMWHAFRAASGVWRNRIRQLKIWKLGVLMAFLSAIGLANLYLESSYVASLEAAVNLACAPFGGSEFCFLGALTNFMAEAGSVASIFSLILTVVYAYTFFLKGVNAILPGVVSFLFMIILLVYGMAVAPVERIILQYLDLLVPGGLFADYATWSPIAATTALWIMKALTAALTCLQVYVTVRIGIGVYREGELFRENPFYVRWSSPAEAVPGVRDVVTEYLRALRSRWGYGSIAERPMSKEDPVSMGGTDRLSEHGEAASREPARMQMNLTKQRAKERNRRANRAARKARRSSR